MYRQRSNADQCWQMGVISWLLSPFLSQVSGFRAALVPYATENGEVSSLQNVLSSIWWIFYETESIQTRCLDHRWIRRLITCQMSLMVPSLYRYLALFCSEGNNQILSSLSFKKKNEDYHLVYSKWSVGLFPTRGGLGMGRRAIDGRGASKEWSEANIQIYW